MYSIKIQNPDTYSLFHYSTQGKALGPPKEDACLSADEFLPPSSPLPTWFLFSSSVWCPHCTLLFKRQLFLSDAANLSDSSGFSGSQSETEGGSHALGDCESTVPAQLPFTEDKWLIFLHNYRRGRYASSSSRFSGRFKNESTPFQVLLKRGFFCSIVWSCPL